MVGIKSANDEFEAEGVREEEKRMRGDSETKKRELELNLSEREGGGGRRRVPRGRIGGGALVTV